MFIAMNRFKVAPDSTQAFERIWRDRESHLHEVPGFQGFHMLRGPAHDDHVLYASHTLWASQDHFTAWTRSEQFRKAHADAGNQSTRATYLEPPQFEGFDVIQEIGPDGTIRSAEG
ncbi:MAG: antibiotic biosynthesis monooxygenase [Pseudomonadota bacterium]